MRSFNLKFFLRISLVFVFSAIFVNFGFAGFVGIDRIKDKTKILDLYFTYEPDFDWNGDIVNDLGECKIQKKIGYYLVSPECLINWRELQKNFDFRNIINGIWTELAGFSNIYPVGIEYSEFTGAQIEFKGDLSFWSKYGNSKALAFLAKKLAGKAVIKIPEKDLFAFLAVKYSYYPVRRFRNGMADCFFTNYRLGIKSLDGYTLYPGKKLNINDWISYLPGWCHKSYENQPFYAGACGTAGQTYRTSLINPALFVTKRSSHAKWRSRRYGEKVLGDDAAIYGNIKVLEIKNIYDLPVYFKAIYGPEIDYFVSIIPDKVDEKVFLEKINLGGMSAFVQKKVYLGDGSLRYSQNWKSYYVEYVK